MSKSMIHLANERNFYACLIADRIVRDEVPFADDVARFEMARDAIRKLRAEEVDSDGPDCGA